MSEMSLNVDTLFGNVESCNTDQLLFHRLHERDLSSSTLVLDGRSHSFFRYILLTRSQNSILQPTACLDLTQRLLPMSASGRFILAQ